MFNRVKNKESAPPKKLPKDLTRLQDASALLALDRRKTNLDAIKDLLHLEDARYQSLAVSLLHALLNYCQSLPESMATFYKSAGGLVNHALQRTEAALSIFQSYLEPDEHGNYSEIQRLWQYALFSASLLQGIGKLYCDFTVQIYDNHGAPIKKWNPLQESLLSHGSYYDYSFKAPDNGDLRGHLNVLMARQLMPLSGFNWIASDESVLKVWLALLNEELYTAGTLGCILDTADAIAIQQEMDRLAKELGKIRAQGSHRLSTFNDRSHKDIKYFDQQTGIQFVDWLRQELASGTLMINKSPLFSVPGGTLMSVDAFKLFVRENPDFKNWQAVQKGFESLGLHDSAADASSLRKFEQHKNQQLITGVVLGAHAAVILPKEAAMKDLSSGEIHRFSATEMVHQMRANPQFQASQTISAAAAPLQAIHASGYWKPPSLASEASTKVQPTSRK